MLTDISFIDTFEAKTPDINAAAPRGEAGRFGASDSFDKTLSKQIDKQPRKAPPAEPAAKQAQAKPAARRDRELPEGGSGLPRAEAEAQAAASGAESAAAESSTGATSPIAEQATATDVEAAPVDALFALVLDSPVEQAVPAAPQLPAEGAAVEVLPLSLRQWFAHAAPSALPGAGAQGLPGDDAPAALQPLMGGAPGKAEGASISTAALAAGLAAMQLRQQSQLAMPEVSASVSREAAAIAETPSTPVSVPLLHGAPAAVASATAPSAMPVLPIHTPPQQPGWGKALGERLVWMAMQNVGEAELRLNPPQLGPLEVRISLNHDQASVSFAAHSAAVRDALESALPRLRDMFAEAGLAMQHTDISQHSFAEQRQMAQEAQGGHHHSGGGEEAELQGNALARLSSGNGLIDYYA